MPEAGARRVAEDVRNGAFFERRTTCERDMKSATQLLITSSAKNASDDLFK
jgi:hypothetical protein